MRKSILAAAAVAMFFLKVIGPVAEAVDISGKTYLEYINDRTEKLEGNDEFKVTRVYINFKEKVDDKIDFRATMDIKSSDYAGKDNYYVVFMKYAYVTFKDVYPGGKLVLGQQSRPWVGFEEKIWEYRWIRKVFADLEGKLSSTGRGISLQGKIPDGYGEYAVAYINGAGYHTKESGEYSKDVSLRLTVQPLENKALKLNVLYYVGKYDTIGLADDTKNRIVGLISYQADKFTVAGELLTSDDKGTKGSGFGGFGILKLNDKVSPFLRYETFDPDTGTSGDEHTRIIAGVSYKLAKKVVAAVNYQNIDYKLSTATDTSALYFHMRVKY